MSLFADIAFGRDTELSQQELNRRAKIIADAIEALREFVPEWEKQVDLLSTVGLNRINEALLPAYQQIIDIADLGALLSTTSSTPVTIGVGTKTFIVPEAVRLNFAPTNFLMAVAGGDFDKHMIGRLSSYDNETGVLVISVERVSGEGEFANWRISPVATTDDLETLRDQVLANAQTATDKAGEAVTARNQAVPAGQAAVAALGEIQAVWYGPRETAPAGAALGAKYLDTSQSPNVVKVLTEEGWAPTVTVSVGGSRQQVYVATEGQTGPFVVDGGFSFGSVNVNGVEFFNEHGVTFNLAEGEFTLDAALSAGDVVVFRGYLANDMTDIYTKSEVDSRLPPQLTPEQATDPASVVFGLTSGQQLARILAEGTFTTATTVDIPLPPGPRDARVILYVDACSVTNMEIFARFTRDNFANVIAGSNYRWSVIASFATASLGGEAFNGGSGMSFVRPLGSNYAMGTAPRARFEILIAGYADAITAKRIDVDGAYISAAPLLGTVKATGMLTGSPTADAVDGIRIIANTGGGTITGRYIVVGE